MSSIELVEGCRVPVLRVADNRYHEAEIVCIRDLSGDQEFYVHYLECKFVY